MTETISNSTQEKDLNTIHTGGSSFSTDSRYYSSIDWVDILFYLLSNIHWILITAIIGAAVSGLYAKFILTPIYQTTSKIYIAGSETTISLSDIQLGSSLAKDYQEVFKIWHVHEMVDERLGLNYSYSKLSGMVSVSNPEGSHLLYINVKSSDPEEAKLLADTYAEVVQEYISEKMELRKPQLLEIAQLPTRPISPNIRSAILKGFVIAAALASTVIIIFYLIDDRIRTSIDIEKASGLGTIGILEKQESFPDEIETEDQTAEKTEGRTAKIGRNLSLEYSGDESVNAICSGILFSGKNMKRIAVTSYEANNGKTFIAMRIASSMAKRRKKVLLIDGDLRKSVMIRKYRIEDTKEGLAHYLSGQCSLEDVIYETNQPNLYLIPAGEIIRNPLTLLTSEDFGHMMSECGQDFDFIIVDTPPVGAVIDAAEIAKHCDGTLLVLEYNKQRSGALRYMQRVMDQTQTPIIGCIINLVTAKSPFQKRYYYHYSGSYDYYGSDKEKSRHRSKTGSASRKGEK